MVYKNKDEYDEWVDRTCEAILKYQHIMSTEYISIAIDIRKARDTWWL